MVSRGHTFESDCTSTSGRTPPPSLNASRGIIPVCCYHYWSKFCVPCYTIQFFARYLQGEACHIVHNDACSSCPVSYLPRPLFLYWRIQFPLSLRCMYVVPFAAFGLPQPFLMFCTRIRVIPFQPVLGYYVFFVSRQAFVIFESCRPHGHVLCHSVWFIASKTASPPMPPKLLTTPLFDTCSDKNVTKFADVLLGPDTNRNKGVVSETAFSIGFEPNSTSTNVKASLFILWIWYIRVREIWSVIRWSHFENFDEGETFFPDVLVLRHQINGMTWLSYLSCPLCITCVGRQLQSILCRGYVMS